MKFTCVKKHIQEAGLLSEKATGHNLSLPILNTVLISTQNKTLKLSSTNLETALEISVPAKVEKEGKAAVPAKLFSSLVSSVFGEEIKFNLTAKNLVLTTDNSSTIIKCYPVEDFPILPEIKPKKSLNIANSDLIGGLRYVYYSASLSEMKPETNSVFVYSSRNTPLTFVATDSFRLAEKTTPYSFSASPNFLLPYRSVVEILRVFEGRDGDSSVALDENNFLLTLDRIKFTSRLTEGSFPDYKQIIPVKFTHAATINRKDLVNALRTAAVFCGKLNEVRLRLYQGEDFVEIQTNNPDAGEHTVNVRSETSGGEFVAVFNHNYLVDCLNSISSERVLLRFAGEGKPLLITGLSDSSFRYLVMPMKDV